MAHHWCVDAWWNHDGAAGDLLGAVLYGALGLELADMTQDEVLQTLRKVIAETDNFTTWTVSTPHLVELVKRAVEAEREACAKVAERFEPDEKTSYVTYASTAIRARGNT